MKKQSEFELYTQHLLEQNGNEKSIVEEFLRDQSFALFIQQFEENLGKRFSTFQKNHTQKTQKELPASEAKTEAATEVKKYEFELLLSAISQTKLDQQEKLDRQDAAPTVQSAPKIQEPDTMKIPSQLASAASPDVAAAATENVSAEAATTPPAAKQAARISDHRDIRFVVANARADEAYLTKLNTDQAQTEHYQILDIVIPPDLGLTYDDLKEELSGRPPTPGEYEISLTYRFMSESNHRVFLLKLTVTPNPKSMWLNKPSDRSDPYWKPDEEASIVKGRDFHLLAASKRGRSHAHVGSFRDDDFRTAYLNDSDWSIAIVSDGAGSCSYSRRGSQIICETALSHITKSLNEGKSDAIEIAAENFYRARAENIDAARIEKLKGDLRNELYIVVCHAAHYALAKIIEEVKLVADRDGKLKDFSSTALISICKKFKFGTLCAAYWVGDGAVGIYSKSKGIRLLGEVDSGEFSGQTRFLDKDEVSQEALVKRLRFELVDDVTAFILMSDGVSDPKFETEARLARNKDWDDLWRDLNAAVTIAHDDEDGKAEKLLGWLDFWSQGNHDDRTIAIIY